MRNILLLLVTLFPSLLLAAPVSVETGDLAGRKFNPDGLYAVWTGFQGTVPARARIDFHSLLQKAWERKCRKNECTPSAKALARDVVKKYPQRPTRMSLADYLKVVEREIVQTYADTDWDIIGAEYRLSRQEKATLMTLMKAVGARELIAYSLTELMPSERDGNLNVAVLTFLLTYAGREYVELLPAVNDGYASFGPYQFTSLALYNDGREVRGASKANRALSKKRVPGSVVRLKNHEHHRAAWLLAIDNLAKVVRNSTTKELTTLARVAQRPSELVKVIACGHHAPAPCRIAAVRWVARGAHGEFAIKGRVESYLIKTRTNYTALQKHVPPTRKLAEIPSASFFFFSVILFLYV